MSRTYAMTSDGGWFTSEDSLTMRRTLTSLRPGHVRASPDGAAEHGLHHVVAFLSEGLAQALEASCSGPRIPAAVPIE